jgi:Ran GTPase-activating protein (RanGAP) involved in mRNA processing and transport
MDLSYNTIDDAGVATIARLLKVNRTLKSINLSGNNIGPEAGRLVPSAGAVPLVPSIILHPSRTSPSPKT